MSAVVAGSWGGYRVSHLVLASLVRAQALALSRRGAPELADVARAVLTAPRSHAVAALTAVGINCDELAATLVATGAGSGSFDQQVSRLLARADQERHRVGDPHVSSIYLMGALAESPDPGLRPLRDVRVGSDLLLSGTARTRARVDSDDVAFAAAPAPAVLHTPATPPLADLMTRTGSRRSASIVKLLNSQMPSGPNATSSPYGKVRAGRWATVQAFHQLLIVTVMLVAIDVGAQWWMYPLLLGSLATPTYAPVPVWGAFVATTMVFTPTPVAVVVLLAALTGGTGAWYELWMKRVDLADPMVSLRQLRRAPRHTLGSMIRNRLGLADEE